MTTQFNFDKKPPIIKWVLLLLSVLLIAYIIIALPGCKVVKSLKKNNTDSVAVRHNQSSLIDTSSSGSLTKTTATTQEQNEWWRTILQFNPGKSKDTNIYNFHNYPASQQPATIIYEGGKGSKETETNTIDSNWLKSALQQFKSEYDSAHKIELQKERNKQVETKGLGLWMIVAIAFASGLAPGILKRIFNALFKNYTFVNPIQKRV